MPIGDVLCGCCLQRAELTDVLLSPQTGYGGRICVRCAKFPIEVRQAIGYIKTNIVDVWLREHMDEIVEVLSAPIGSIQATQLEKALEIEQAAAKKRVDQVKEG